MFINEDKKTVEVSRSELIKNMVGVFEKVTEGYTVIVTLYKRPVAHITKARQNTEFIQE